MAEAFAVIGLASSIVQFVQVTTRVMERFRELKRATHGLPGTLADLYDQLPLLINLVNRIHADCEQRRRSSVDLGPAAERDEQLVGAVLGMRRQVERLEEVILAWQPNKTSFFHRFRKTLASFAKEEEIAAIERRLETFKSLLTLNFSIPIEDRKASKTTELTSYNVLPRHVSRFLGREKVLQEIIKYHQAQDGTSRHRIVALQGMGGQGKTQTALEYCRRFREMELGAKVVWLDASSPVSILRSFDQVYVIMFPSEPAQLDQKYKRQVVLREIATWQCPWLIVYDNHDKPNLFGNIAENFPTATGTILFTTRNAQAGERLGHCIKLSGIDPEDGVDLFLYRTGYDEKNIKNARAEAAKIVQRLGYLPLAIDQAAAYIKARRLPLTEFWNHFNKRRDKVLNHTPSANWEYRRSSPDSETEKSLSVFTTWELSLEEFNTGTTTENQSVDTFLTFASVFHSSTISEMLFRHMTLKAIENSTINKNEWLKTFTTNKEWDSFAYQDVIAQCYELSLLQTFNINGEQTTFTLHPLIADWLRLRKSPEARWETLQEASSSLASFITEHHDPKQTMCNRYLFNVQTSWEVVYYINDCLEGETVFRATNSNKQLAAECLEAFATIYWAMDKYYESKQLLLRAVDKYAADRGEEDESTLIARHSLGEVQSHLDELEDASKHFGKVLEIRQRSISGTNEPILAARYQQGVIHRRRGDYALAIEEFRTCVAAVEAGSIPLERGIDWFASYGSALAYTSQVQEAEVMLRKAIQMCIPAGLEARLEHIWPTNWLIRLLCTMGRLTEANSILTAIYPKAINQYGPSSWEANFMDELIAFISWKRGDLEEAKKSFQACLEVYNKLYEKFDADEILGVTYALGDINLQQGNLSEAHRLLKDSAAGYERMCGFGTSTALDPLGILLEVAVKEKDNQTIEQTLSRIELTLKQTFDDKALYVLNLNVHMCHAYLYLGKRDVARSYLERAAAGFAEVIGLEHSRTRQVQQELADF